MKKAEIGEYLQAFGLAKFNKRSNNKNGNDRFCLRA